MGRLTGKVAIVTGAASGMGAAEAELFAAEGASVVATDVNLAALEKVVARIQEQGDRALALQHDVSCRDSWDQVVRQTENAFGDVTVLMNNAGIWNDTGYEDMTHEAWLQMMNVNAWGPFAGIQAVLPSMKRAGVGSIINVASMAAVNACGRFSAYTCSKGSVDAMTRAAAIDLAPFNIRVNCINPGVIRTAMVETAFPEEALVAAQKAQPLQRIGRPVDVAYMALYFASDESWFTSGTSQLVDGAMAVMGGVAPALASDPADLERT